ncbi:putative fad dependent oxidoreductase [Diplodia seriata]|uniref:Putative fad dependent oxidoreductase n=1 Tax=Diplodia seriata TaxID=420778 RepID=A0A0G2GFX6_9PEZI|nr:putative fad dependent oxidoreductase [Diplodia seriata]
MASETPKNIVVIGGGIIGSSSAYFLSHHSAFDPTKTNITLLEATEIAGGASGKAGGLLGLWAYPSCIVPLSFRLHKELADKYDGAQRWGYRGVHCGQILMKGRPVKKGGADVGESVSLQKRTPEALGQLRAAGVPKDLDWVVPEGVRAYEEMGAPDDTAQVHPYHFTTSMAQLAEEKGAKVVLGSVTDINTEGGEVRGVTYTPKDGGEAQTIPADSVIVSAGPWTRNIWPKAPISATRAHSVVIKPPRDVSNYALFTSIDLPSEAGASGKRRGYTTTVSPEIYARPFQEVYACGEGDHLVPLPKTTEDVEVDQQRCQDVIDYVSAVSDELRDGEVTARQACYLPNVSRGSGGPMIGKVPGVKGLVIAAGHTCWGIQNGPGTGKLVSEIVWDGKAKSANIASLDPAKWL